MRKTNPKHHVAKEQNSKRQQITPKAKLSNSPKHENTFIDLQQAIMKIQDLNLKNHRILKQLLRQKMSLWRQLYNSVGYHWKHLVDIMSETDLEDAQTIDSRKEELFKKEIFRKLSIVANRIVSMRIYSSFKLKEFTKKAINLQKSQCLHNDLSSSNPIKMQQSLGAEQF